MFGIKELTKNMLVSDNDWRNSCGRRQIEVYSITHVATRICHVLQYVNCLSCNSLFFRILVRTGLVVMALGSYFR